MRGGSKRLEQIKPYPFAELERKIAEKRAAGVDVISPAGVSMENVRPSVQPCLWM